MFKDKIVKLLLINGIKGATRAEMAQLLLNSNEQHRVTAPVKELIKEGVVIQIPVRRNHPTGGRSGKVILLAGVAQAYNELAN